MQSQAQVITHTVLARNKACHQCRKAKRKCDGLRPMCTACRNPMRRSAEVDCTWDDPAPNESIRQTSEEGESTKRQRARDINDKTNGDDGNGVEEAGPSTWTAGPDDLYWPNWPADLPHPSAVEYAVRMFFAKAATVRKMIHGPTLLGRLSLSPSHADFPATSLLHAIIASAASYIPASTLESSIFYPSRTSNATPTRYGANGQISFLSSSADIQSEAYVGKGLQAWHRQKALERVAEQLDRGEKLLQCLQTNVIVAFIDTLTLRSFAMWQENSACLRLAVALQINETQNTPADCINRYSGQVLSPNPTPIENAERDRTFWCAYLADHAINMMGNWPSCLTDEEITVELPVNQALYELGIEALRGTQTFRSPDFYLAHPIEIIGGLAMSVKAARLGNEITKFVREYARGPHTEKRYLVDSTRIALEQKVIMLRANFPPEHRKMITGPGTDGDMLAAVLLTHWLSLPLGEHVIADDWRGALPRAALSSIQAILALVHSLLESSYDMTLLPLACPLVWWSCAKILSLFNDAALRTGDIGAASVFYKQRQALKNALLRFGEKHSFAVQLSRRLDQLAQYQSTNGDIPEKLYMDFQKELSDESKQPSWTIPAAPSLGTPQATADVTPDIVEEILASSGSSVVA